MQRIGSLIDALAMRPPKSTAPFGQAERPKQDVQCPICRDAGFLRHDVPYGHPQFGKLKMCQCRMAQRKKSEQEKMKHQSGLFRQEATFGTFNSRAEGVKQAHRAASGYAQDPDGWLVLMGRNGCGKTHLATAIAYARIEAGDHVMAYTAPDLLDLLRAGYDQQGEEAYIEVLERIKTVELLIIDDLGAQNGTGWACEKFFQVFNHRYVQNLSTVITTNKMSLQEFEPRLASRLGDKRIVDCVLMDQAQDYRLGQTRE